MHQSFQDIFFFVRQDNLTLEVELYKIGFLSFLKEEEEIIQSVEIIHDETDCNRILRSVSCVFYTAINRAGREKGVLNSRLRCHCCLIC